MTKQAVGETPAMGEMMTVVAITGVSGQFGQSMLPRLDADPRVERIIGLDVAPPKNTTSKLEFHECDVRNPKLAALLEGADIVVHLGSVIFTRYGEEAEAEDINVNGSMNVANSAARSGARKLIVASSVAVYGIHDDNDRPLTEESPARGDEDLDYARSKAAVERFLDLFAADHPEMVVTRLRPCMVLGPSTDPARYLHFKGSVFPLKRKQRQEPMQYVHEDDVVSAFLLAIRNDAPGAYNVAGPEPELLSDLARALGMRVITLPRFLFKLIERMVPRQWRRGKIPTSAEWLRVTACPTSMSTAKIEKELGWRPKYTTREALMATIRGERDLELAGESA